MKEKEIIKSILRGNQEAFRDLLLMYEHRVYHFIKQLVYDPHISEDLTQETFIAVYRSLHTYDGNKSFTTWLFTIAKHTAYRAIKKSGKINLSIPIDDLNLVDTKSDTLNALVIEENNMRLLDSIDCLKAVYQEVIMLKYFSDYSYKEIAIALNISVKKVENRLHAAKKALAKSLNDEGGMESLYEY